MMISSNIEEWRGQHFSSLEWNWIDYSDWRKFFKRISIGIGEEKKRKENVVSRVLSFEIDQSN